MPVLWSPHKDARATSLSRPSRRRQVYGLEGFGYRQLNSLWGCIGTAQALTGKVGWGSMKRQAFRT